MSDQGKDGQGDPWAHWRKPAEPVASGDRAVPKTEAPVVVEPLAPVAPPAAEEKRPGEPLGTLSVRKRIPAAKVDKTPTPRGAKEGRAPSAGFKGDRKPGPAGRSAPPRRDDARSGGRPVAGRTEDPWGRSAGAKPPRPAVERENPWAKKAAAVPPAAKLPETPKGPPPEGVRLSKVMSERGLCSRREADLWIERGWVFVDGEQVSELGSRIDPSAKIEISTEAKKDQAKAVTILIHKPVGYVSSQPEPGCIPAVTLITPEAQVVQSGDPEFKPWMLRGLAPAGRLDVDSTGLLVLTSDGRVAKRLIGEDSEAEKEYLVRVSGEMIKGGLDLLRHGLELDGKPLRQAWVKQLNEDQLHFILKEGKKRQIRRMCELVGLKVIGLKRVRIGRIRLGDLPMGQWRFLRADEAF